jgi:hypothetical protein
MLKYFFSLKKAPCPCASVRKINFTERLPIIKENKEKIAIAGLQTARRRIIFCECDKEHQTEEHK